mgnify:CR=1 FL=1
MEIAKAIVKEIVTEIVHVIISKHDHMMETMAQLNKLVSEYKNKCDQANNTIEQLKKEQAKEVKQYMNRINSEVYTDIEIIISMMPTGLRNKISPELASSSLLILFSIAALSSVEIFSELIISFAFIDLLNIETP